jgi:hypothetical protein
MAVQYAFSQITTQGLRLAVDAADPLSYPGSGTVLTDVSGNGFTGNVSSSISFAVTNRGALFSPNSSSAITFSGSAVNFGTDSFTVEMAFSPQVINGQHFLYSKNSGSFPNFGAFLTGSGGSGRLVAFYNISSTISCSASTPTGSFITGSNYIVDVTYVPSQLTTAIYTNSNFVTQSAANGTGSLSTSASLFLLNNSTSSNVGSVANLYNFKVYNPNLSNPFIRKNYNAQAARFGLPLATYIPPAPLLLDTYSGAAAAYSLRKLRTSYLGAAIRVRRSSDNTEADIGFNFNDELDTTALLAFCGAGNGFVTIWYDQSGNGRNATQTTAANQPQIVSSGNIILDNGKPSAQFDGINDLLEADSLATVFSGEDIPLSRILVLSPNTVASQNFFSFGNTGSNSPLKTLEIVSSDIYQLLYRTNTGISKSTNFPTIKLSQQLLDEYNSGTITNVFLDSINKISNFDVDLGIINLNTATIGALRRTATVLFYSGKIQEIILYNSNQSSNRTGIETNINDFYSIY